MNISDRIGPQEFSEQADYDAGNRDRSFFDDDDAPRNKRQRTALACNSCRARKSRCNGAHPICATCRDLGFECVYRGPAVAPRRQTREMQTVEERIQKIEEMLLAMANRQQQTENTTVRFAPQADHISFQGGLNAQDTSTLALSNFNGFQQGQSRLSRNEHMAYPWPTAQEDTVDGMGSIIFADESSSGFFGPSSNSSFFSNIAKVLSLGAGSMPENRDFSQDLAANMSRPPSPPLQSKVDPSYVNPYRLPSRSEIVRLIGIFFSFTGHFFPYISKSNITKMVEELDMIRFTGVRKSWLCLLNAILAMGTSLDRERGAPLKSVEAKADVFFQRALVLSPLMISNTANLETLQALMVMTQYLQGTSHSAQTWRLHGLLVQAAFQNGIHFKDSNSKLSAFEQEVRTRIWYTCIVLDRILSTTFGRPPLIHNELIQIEMPLNIELDELPKDSPDFQAPQNPNSAGSTGIIFIPSINLFRIQGDIIANVYNHNLTSSQAVQSSELYSKILQIDYELTKWKRELPPISALLPHDLIEDMVPQTQWDYSRTQTVLTLRYLNVRALLFRKVLEQSLYRLAKPGTLPEDAGYSLPIGNIMVQACTNSCIQTIAVIRKVGPKPQLLPAWWYTAYYLFNSALILFGVICLQTLGRTDTGTKPATELLVCLQTAIEALHVAGEETRIVRRCSKYLRKIIQVSTLLVRNHVSAQGIPPDASALINSLPNDIAPSLTDESSHSPLETDFGQFLIDQDYSFLDVWSEFAQQNMTNPSNL